MSETHLLMSEAIPFKNTRQLECSIFTLVMKYVRFLFFWMCGTWGCFSWAQTPVYKHYTTEDGLPSNNLYFVHQDVRGFIWVATERGLSKFNGYHFKTLTRNDGLPYNNIFEIQEDVKKRLWIRGYGKQIVQLVNDSINIFHYAAADNNPNRYIRAYKLDSTQNYLASVVMREGVIDALTGKLLPHELDSVSIALSEKVNVCFSKDKRFLVRYQEGSNSYRKLICSPVVVRPSEYACLQLTSGHILLAEANKLYVLYQKKIVIVKNFHDQILFMRENDDGSIFLSFNQGGVMEFKDSTFNNSTASMYLPDKRVTSVIKDKQGGRWFTTLGNGLYYLPKNYFKSIPTNADNNYWEQPVSVQHIAAQPEKGLDADKLLLFTRKGKLYLADFPLCNFSEIFDTKTELSKVYIDKNNISWIASHIHVDVFNPYTTELKRNSQIEVATLLKPDATGKLWVFGHTGVKIYADTIHFSKPITLLPHQKLTNMVAYRGSYWISGYEGLWKYEHDSLIYMGDKNPLFQSRIDNMVVKDSVLYISTRGQGVLIQYPDTLIQISKGHGLQENITTCLYVDNQSTIWVGSSKGIDCIRPISTTSRLFSVTHITKDDGLLTNNINDISGYKSQVYVCTDKGITFFDSEKLLRESKTDIPLYINQVKVNDQKAYAPADSMVFLPAENTIAIEYVAISPRDVKNLAYRYRLQGAELGWVQTRHTNVRFPNLPPGVYLFELQVKGSNGDWGKTVTTSFTILTPIEDTLWFQLIFILVCSGIVFLGVRWRIVQLKNKNAVQQELNHAKRLALKAQMNPHFIFNSLNSIQKYIMEHDRKNASIYLSQFSMLVRKTLDYSEKEYITLDEEITLLTTYLELESLRFKNNFAYDIKCLHGFDVTHIYIPPLILQPFIENAIWHGLMPKTTGDKKISVHFFIENDALHCLIKDNGIGREASRKLTQNKPVNFTSMGIKITENRLKLINKQYKLDMKLTITDLYNSKNEASGTQVLITFPLKDKL